MSRRVVITLALAVGAALVATTGAIHLHLWATGYRTIPTSMAMPGGLAPSDAAAGNVPGAE